MAGERWEKERVGLGYRVVADSLGPTEMKLTRVKRRSDGIYGEIKVIANIAGVKAIDGVMHMSRFNVSSSSARNSLAKLLASRAPGIDVDWYDGIEALSQFVMLSESSGQPFLDVGDKMRESSMARYVLDPLVPANVSSLLYGPGGSGKSIIALAGAMSVQAGVEIIPGIMPSVTGNVLYLDWETDAPVINDRIMSIADGAGIKPPRITYRRCIKPLADEVEDVANAVAERDIVFVVIDSAGMAMGTGGEYGDANESTLRLFDAIRYINVTTQIIDHVSKQEIRSKGKVTGLLPYGSVYKVNLARSAWEVRNGTSETDELVRLALLHTKSNDSRLLQQRGLEIDWRPHSIVFSLPDVYTPVVARDATKDAITEYLQEHGPTMRIKIADDLSSYPKSTVLKTAGRMLEKGEIVLMPGGQVCLPGQAVAVNTTPGNEQLTYRN